ncbi:MAG: helix-turn-helix transcriptional regulator [Croceivirga sp.]
MSSSFYARLNDQFEGLTKTDVRLCSFIKLNLNTKQIATLQNINPSSVKMSRNRLRKKLHLTPEADLSSFLQTF